MGLYLSGVFVAGLIGLAKLIISLFTLFSTKATNLKKIGLYYDPSIGDFSKKQPSWRLFIFIVFDLLIISPLLSWLSVGWSAFLYIKNLVNRESVPEIIRELRFKLSSINLPKVKVQELMREISKFYGIDISDIDDRVLAENEDDDPDSLVLEDGINDVYLEIQISRNNKTFKWYYHTSDYSYNSETVYEYKFDGFKLSVRVLESKNDSIGSGEEFEIKDNVIMENDIRNRYDERYSSFNSLEDKINKLKKDIDWSDYAHNRIKYFLIFRHSDIFNNVDIRKYFRSEIERLMLGHNKIFNEITSFGFDIVKENNYSEVKCSSDVTEDNYSKMRQIRDNERITDFGISYYEFEIIDDLKQDLQKYLDKL